MDEIVAGVFHWSAYHPGIGSTVHSHFVASSGTAIDPLEPPADLAAERVVLTNRHHLRHAERLGVPILCNEAGLHEFAGGPEVEGFAVGDEVAPGITAQEMGGICPDDTALLIDAGPGVLAFADAVVRRGDGPLAFVPDSLWGDPERDKAAVRRSLERLVELDFDSLLFAHGAPMASGGKAAIREFLS
jgi:glyoxylase-like metal-dependent hydrolase (beta-lactamase superfamily II)